MNPCRRDALPGVTCVASGSGRFAILTGTELEGKPCSGRDFNLPQQQHNSIKAQEGRHMP